MALILDGTDGITSSGGTNVLQDDAVITANIADGAVSDAKIAAMAAAKLTGRVPAANVNLGGVLQVVSTFKNDVFSASLAGGSFTDITGFSATITPTSTSSKILVLANFGLSASSPAVASRLLRNGTLISNGAVSGSRVSASSPSVSNAGDGNRGVPTSISFLDSPATTLAVTYKLQIGAIESSGTFTAFFNTSGSDGDFSYIARMGSSITLMEIAA